MEDAIHITSDRQPANGRVRITAGKLTGQKPALKMKEVWSIRTRLELDGDIRNLALFNLAIDSKLRGCDLVRLKVGDVAAGGEVKSRAVCAATIKVRFSVNQDETRRRGCDEGRA